MKWLSGFDTETPPTPRTVASVLATALRVAIMLAVAVVAAYKVADQIYWRKVQEQRLAFKERYGAVDFRDFVPEPPPAARDAGRAYQYAAALVARAGVSREDPSPFRRLLIEAGAFSPGARDSEPLAEPTPLDVAVLVKDAMAALDGVWPVLRKADAKEGGALTHFYEPGKTDTEPDELRGLADLMAAKAIVEARGGDMDAAARWLESGMHLADLLRREPTIMAQMLRIAVMEANTLALQEVLNAGGGMPALSDPYFEDWDRAADPAWFIRGMASELGLYWSQEIPGVPRLRRSMLILDLGAWFDRIVAAMEPGAPGPARLRGARNVGFPGTFASGISGPAGVLNGISGELAPFATRKRAIGPWPVAEPAALSNLLAACCYFEIPVRHAQVRLGLAIRWYHTEHGQFPDTLDTLVPAYIDAVPVDPATGRAMAYTRQDGTARLKSPGLLERHAWEFTLK